MQIDLRPVTNEASDKRRFQTVLNDFAGGFGFEAKLSASSFDKLSHGKPTRQCWPAVYWVDEAKSGFVSLVEFPHFIEIKSIFVCDANRRRGLGQAVVSLVCTQAERVGKSVFTLIGKGGGAAESVALGFWCGVGFTLTDAYIHHALLESEPVADAAKAKPSGRAVYEFEDDSWQWDLGLVNGLPEFGSLPYETSPCAYTSYVSTEASAPEGFQSEACYLGFMKELK